MTRRAVLAAAALACVATEAPAQVVRLGARLPDGLEAHRAFQVVTRIEAYGPTGGTPAVSEYAYVGGLRVVRLTGARGEAILHLAFDSLTARAREGRGPWRERIVEGTDTLWTQLLMGDDDRPAARRGDGVESALLVDLWTCAPGLWLEPRDARSGDRWPVEIIVPVAPGILPPEGGVHGVGAVGTLTLDSIVARARDTLAYLALDVAVRAAAIRLPDGARLIPGGSVRGVIIWSTAWAQCVSGAHRAALGLRLEPTGGEARTFTVATTMRQAVLPSR
jgi:hypothetical protein